MINARLSSTAWRLGVPAAIASAGAVAGLVGLGRFQDNGNGAYSPWAALLFCSVGILLVFVVFDAIAGRASSEERRKYGWVNAVLGADGRISTSRVQIFLWTTVVSAALLYLAGVAIFSVAHDDEVLQQTDWDDYLILLGGPFAAGVLAKYAVATKIEQGNLQKTVLPTASAPAGEGVTELATPGAPRATDALTNDAGELDLVDSQYLVFNLVALIYVVGVFVSQIIDKGVEASDKYSLPDVPGVLLGLTSAAAATYVANKAALKNPPVISSLNPPQPQSGHLVEILGTNLQPTGSGQVAVAGATLVVVKGQGTPAVDSVLPATTATPTKVTFTMPPAHSGQQVDLQVITTANVATPPYRTTVL